MILAETPGLAELVILPATCGQPPLDWRSVEHALGDAVDDEVWILGGGGCLGRLGNPPRPNWHVHPGAHCQALVAGGTLVDECLKQRAHLLTPGWLAHWRERIARWGFDEVGARAFFAETAQSLVLFDTGVLPGSGTMLEEMARYVGLPERSIPVGIDHLRLLVEGVALRSRVRRAEAAGEREMWAGARRAQRELADLNMVLDLVTSLTGIAEERVVAQKVLNLCTVLFAPSSLAFLDIVEGVPAEAAVESAAGTLDLWPLRWFCASPTRRETLGTAGFMVKLTHQGEGVGAVLVDGIQFPAHGDHYLGLASIIADVAGLAIANARAYGKLQRTLADLQAATENVTMLEGLIPICAYCKKIRDDKGYWEAVESYVYRAPSASFTHGICEACVNKHFPDEGGEEPKPGSG